MHDEEYQLETGESGLDYESLDLFFNPTTKSFMKANGLKPDLNILEIGCGSGNMTSFIAKEVEPLGQVIAIDNSESQLLFAKKTIQKAKCQNVTFKLLSAYNLDELNESFDIVYCRFVMHHLHSPRKAIQLIYDCLKPGGTYFSEEGIISAAFCYPPSSSWQFTRAIPQPPELQQDGVNRDGDIGMKMPCFMKEAGFQILDASLVQPLLTKISDKQLLLKEHGAFKKTALKQGMSEIEWQKQYEELARIASDDKYTIGFYQSC
ncbi:TPA: class I SAM-dependent methyltransferase, partial [Legionella pneumophila]